MACVTCVAESQLNFNLRDIRTGRLQRILRGHCTTVRALAALPGGMLISASGRLLVLMLLLPLLLLLLQLVLVLVLVLLLLILLLLVFDTDWAILFSAYTFSHIIIRAFVRLCATYCS